MEGEKKGCTVGLDLSLTASGVCVKRGDDVFMTTVKTTPKKFPCDLNRYAHVRDQILSLVPVDTEMICIEDFYQPRNPLQIGSALVLAIIGGLIRVALYEAGYKIYIISPTQLKKFGTGKGNISGKGMVLKEIYKRWGVEAKNDNEADACVLAYLAESLTEPITEDMPKFKKDVLFKIINDRPNYNLPDGYEPWRTT